MLTIDVAALYQTLGLPLPGTKKCDEYLLVYGGSAYLPTQANHVQDLANQTRIVSRHWCRHTRRSICCPVSLPAQGHEPVRQPADGLVPLKLGLQSSCDSI